MNQDIEAKIRQADVDMWASHARIVLQATAAIAEELKQIIIDHQDGKILPGISHGIVKILQVDAVVNNLQRVITKIRGTDNTAEPGRRRDHRQARGAGKSLFFAPVVFGDVLLEQGERVAPRIGAAAAFRTVLRAVHIFKMRTIAGHAPAVMEGPDNRDAALFQIAEQHLDIQVITVQIMQMNHIRLKCFNPPDQLFGLGAVGKPVVVEKDRSHGGRGIACEPCHFICFKKSLGRIVFFPAVADQGLVDR